MTSIPQQQAITLSKANSVFAVTPTSNEPTDPYSVQDSVALAIDFVFENWPSAPLHITEVHSEALSAVVKGPSDSIIVESLVLSIQTVLKDLETIKMYVSNKGEKQTAINYIRLNEVSENAYIEVRQVVVSSLRVGIPSSKVGSIKDSVSKVEGLLIQGELLLWADATKEQAYYIAGAGTQFEGQ